MTERLVRNDRDGRSVLGIPAAALAALPLCPACYPAYAGILSALGLTALSSTTAHTLMTIIFVSTALGALLYKARSRRGYGPFALGALASVVLSFAKFVMGSDPITYIAVSALVLAGVWNVLPRFLAEDFVPTLETISAWADAECRRTGSTLNTSLSMEEQTLSPSDFGFHNAIRTDTGLVFLDFEHFGWDDPAKTISDFVLHPAMDLSKDLKQRFISRSISAMVESGALAQRLPVVYPLFGLKWCMIFLNEFLKEGLERRQFATGTMLAVDTLQAGQLVKTKNMLQQIAGEYEHFPYNL